MDGMTDHPPFYNFLGHPAEDLTDDQRAVLEASEAEVDAQAAEATGAYGGIEDALEWLDRRGWWCEIKSPFEPGDLYWAGLTPHSTSGWMGKPDHQVGDVTLRGALWRAILLMLIQERMPADEGQP